MNNISLPLFLAVLFVIILFIIAMSIMDDAEKTPKYYIIHIETKRMLAPNEGGIIEFVPFKRIERNAWNICWDDKCTLNGKKTSYSFRSVSGFMTELKTAIVSEPEYVGGWIFSSVGKGSLSPVGRPSVSIQSMYSGYAILKPIKNDPTDTFIVSV